MSVLDEKIRQLILRFQKNEITEHFVYKNLAEKTKGKNGEVGRNTRRRRLRPAN